VSVGRAVDTLAVLKLIGTEELQQGGGFSDRYLPEKPLPFIQRRSQRTPSPGDLSLPSRYRMPQVVAPQEAGAICCFSLSP
jgi:hypothetical protein